MENLTTGKILMLCPGGLDHGGGIGRQMGYFLDAQQCLGTGLDYIVVDTRGRWFLGSSPFFIVFSLAYFVYAAIKICGARRSNRPVIVHANIAGRGSTIRKTILLFICRAVGLRYILHVHDYSYAEEFLRRGVLMKKIIATTFRHAAKILMLGSKDMLAVEQLMRLDHGQAVIFPNAVPDPSRKQVNAQYRTDVCRLLFLGHLSERKGVPELLHALARPALRSRRWNAIVAGGGPIEQFKGLAKELCIADRVDFPGWVDRSTAQALCAGADVLVLPSHAEGLAMAVLEGLANGLAVITTPVGAHPEVIEPEVSGILVPPGNVDALTDALLRVIDNENLRQHLGIGARRRFLEKFDVNTYAARLSELHVALLSKDSKRVEPVGNKGYTSP